MNQYKLYLTLEVSKNYTEESIQEFIKTAAIELAENLEAYIVDLEIK